MCDLDGVVYRGAEAVPHAVEELGNARGNGSRVVFATNNASRPPAVVADALRGLGVRLDDADVLTSSMAGAGHLAQQLPAGAAVLAIGGPGVADALNAAGMRAVLAADAATVPVDAVLQGFGAEVTAAELGEAAYAIQRGARWVATNNDMTLPTDRGVAPGNGSLVAAVQVAVDVEPTVVGKPGPLLYELAAEALGTGPDSTLGIGDRLETDTAGAHAAGMDALHVLTGVHGPADLVRAPRGLRPRFIGVDLRVLGEPYAEPARAGDGRWTAAGWTGTLVGQGDSARVSFETSMVAETDLAWIAKLRLALPVLWEALDQRLITEAEAVAALPQPQ
ncbi:HAD-IIA family hydrolase [Flexivirga alba]|uniref:HAD-IIA family hydrolase n=1 Tax=Flexivirga alba TaxID=702742 RepID=A0ABW2AL97_9MICO